LVWRWGAYASEELQFDATPPELKGQDYGQGLSSKLIRGNSKTIGKCCTIQTEHQGSWADGPGSEEGS
jgi:hypothetical protein